MSLRARLLAGMAVVSFVLVAAAVIIGRTTENNLVDRVDEQLAPVAVGLSRANGPFSSPVSPGGGSPPTQLYGAQIADGSLTVVFTPNVSAGTVGAPEVSIATATQAARGGHPVTVGATNGSGRYRLLAIRSPDGSIGVSALSLQDVDATMDRLRLVLIVAVGMVIAILGLVVFWVLRLGVRPIKRMTKTAGAIAAGDLSQRVPAGRSGTEASELGDSLNAMLTTIEGAFAERAAFEARLRRFVADLARLDEGRPLARPSTSACWASTPPPTRVPSLLIGS